MEVAYSLKNRIVKNFPLSSFSLNAPKKVAGQILQIIEDLISNLLMNRENK